MFSMNVNNPKQRLVINQVLADQLNINSAVSCNQDDEKTGN